MNHNKELLEKIISDVYENFKHVTGAEFATEVAKRYAEDAIKKDIQQVKEEIEGMWSQTCGIRKDDYIAGSKEALNRLEELKQPKKYSIR